MADDAVELLLDIGWHPGNVALLTTGSRHPVQIERTDHHGQIGYWRTYWDDDVFYGHVLGCKGLERPAVVLCVNESQVRDRSREKLYVGMSRATDHLIVVGDPDLVREIGGPLVAERLGIGVGAVSHTKPCPECGEPAGLPILWGLPHPDDDGSRGCRVRRVRRCPLTRSTTSARSCGHRWAVEVRRGWRRCGRRR